MVHVTYASNCRNRHSKLMKKLGFIEIRNLWVAISKVGLSK